LICRTRFFPKAFLWTRPQHPFIAVRSISGNGKSNLNTAEVCCSRVMHSLHSTF
jgi:hypothetical protein